ncbi:MAG: type II toxin-antitoxin system VapC family toxin [Actinomycetes bacterium]
MIAYFDTSALVPLLVEEHGSTVAGQLWDQADRVTSVRLVYAEARAALARAERLGRLTRRQLPRLVEQLDGLYAQLDRVEVDDALVRRAGQLAQDLALRGYDAVHLAALERIGPHETVMVAGDDDLRAAAAALGFATASTSSPAS